MTHQKQTTSPRRNGRNNKLKERNAQKKEEKGEKEEKEEKEETIEGKNADVDVETEDDLNK